jgi:hypothetical protein
VGALVQWMHWCKWVHWCSGWVYCFSGCIGVVGNLVVIYRVGDSTKRIGSVMGGLLGKKKVHG